MNWGVRAVTAVVCAAGLLGPPCWAGDPRDYLAGDGRLREAVTFRRVTMGLAPAGAPRAEDWVIEPTGEWTNRPAGAKGRLSGRQLAALAHHLAAQDFDALPRAQGYRPRGPDEPYQEVAIGFGRKSAAFHVRVGESRIDYLPEPGDPQAAAWSRFVALELALADLLRAAEGKAKAKE